MPTNRRYRPSEHQRSAELAALLRRVRSEAEAADAEAVRVTANDPGSTARCAELSTLAMDGSPASRDTLAEVLVEPGQPLWAREVAAFTLGCAGDQRAFETLIFLLNYRDPVRGGTAAHALVRLGDPRTARAAAALATNELRTAYALHPVRLLVALRAPESVPTLTALLARLLQRPGAHTALALACVEGLGRIGDPRARVVLREAAAHHRLRPAAQAALAKTGG